MIVKKLVFLILLTVTACQPHQDIHITGHIQSQNTGLLGLTIKNRININFNGYEVMTGYLDKQNSANLVGVFNNKEVSAKCSGAETIQCVISYDNNTNLITFKTN